MTPAPQATPVSPGQLELFPRVVLHYARPDGGPLTDADFELLAELARTATTRTRD
ncbi:hypothetical protein ABZ419_27180 [Streptomyces cinnamoneus]|uniref:hypothetical protein n=1 Tax=Streptomyces cinnamoneus TaxID=53446 RepID=UPI0033DD6EFC